MKINFQRGLWGVVSLLFLTLAVARVGFAQVDTGAVLGTVRDITGAVVPGATVTLINEGTGLSLQTTTSRDGSYDFTPIKIGSYSVTVKMAGFQTVTQSHITVNVQSQVKVNVTLRPGRVTQTVEVKSAPPQLQTQNASVGQVATERQINDLPLNGRNYTFLAQLSAGVTSVSPSRGLDGTGSFVANGLGTELNNYILDGVDNNNDSIDFLNGAAYVMLPPPDAIQEFKVQTSNFSAEFGRAGGAVINATIKSGTNRLHGDAWEFLRNNALDASNFFNNARGVKKGELRQNQFGFSLGGPVVIPHLYNGHNKTFFFGDYQGTRIRQGAFETASVPTLAESASGFTNFQDLFAATNQTATDLLGRTFNANTILDPATTRLVTAGQVDPVTGLMATGTGYVRDPFYTCGSIANMTNFATAAQEACMNMLPAGRLDQNAIKILGLYPSPNTPGDAAGTQNNFAINRGQPDNVNHFDVRVDQDFSASDQGFAAVSYSKRSEFIPGSIVGLGSNAGFGQGNFTSMALSTVLSETHLFSPTMVNELRIGFTRLHTVSNPTLTNQPGIPEQFGIQGVSQENGNYGLPNINIDGLTSLGAGGWATPNIRYTNTWQLSENLTKIYGKHTFKMGFEGQWLRFPWLNTTASRGQFYFGTYTGIPSGPEQTGGPGIADLLLTPITSTVAGGINYVGGPRYVNDSNVNWIDDVRHYYATYFQDDWKFTPNLTLNLGLRWEFFGQLKEKYGADAILNPGVYTGLNTVSGATYILNSRYKNTALSPSFTSLLAKDGIGLSYSSVPGLMNTPLTDFSPRVGVAWQATNRLVMRLGYGIYFGGFQNLGGAVDPGFNYPNVVTLNSPAHDNAHPIIYADGQRATLEHGLLSLEPNPNNPGFSAQYMTLVAFQPQWKTGYTQEWNATLQYQLAQNQTVTLSYVGNTSRHLLNGYKANLPNEILPATLPPGQTSQDYVPFPDFASNSDFIAPNGNSFYYGFHATYEKRFSSGLQALADYTYSRCMTDARNILNSFGNNFFTRAGTIPGFGLAPDYHFCGSDSPSIFHLSGVYQLPFGHGEHFGRSLPNALNQVVGGWSVQSIVTIQNGFPFNVGCPVGTNSFPSSNNCVADLVAGKNLYSHIGPHGITQFLNPAAFATPPVATTFSQTDFAPFGGRPFQAHGPTFADWDFSIFKNFQTTENTHLQFRGEFFNVLNHPNFGNPGNLNFLNTSVFSNITGTRGIPREIQLALKFYF